MSTLQSRIEAFAAGGEADPEAVHEVIRLVDCGELRVAEKIDGEWAIHEWVRSAILLYFRVAQMEVCLLYTSPSPRDRTRSRMPSSA